MVVDAEGFSACAHPRHQPPPNHLEGIVAGWLGGGGGWCELRGTCGSHAKARGHARLIITPLRPMAEPVRPESANDNGHAPRARADGERAGH